MYLNCRRIASFILLYNSQRLLFFFQMLSLSLAFLFFEIHSGAIGGGRQRRAK
jgi:zona occludens toxin (predicted ATPase)